MAHSSKTTRKAAAEVEAGSHPAPSGSDAEPVAAPGIATREPKGAGPQDPAVIRPEQPAVLTVVGPARGRRRAGRQFGAEAVRIPLAELTEQEVEALIADPALAVSGLPTGLAR
jgi:hypothetical protein